MKKIIIFFISIAAFIFPLSATTEKHIKDTVKTIVDDMYTEHYDASVAVASHDSPLIICFTENDNNGQVCTAEYTIKYTLQYWYPSEPRVYIYNGILGLSDTVADELLMIYLPQVLCKLEEISDRWNHEGADSYEDIYNYRMQKVREHKNEELYLIMLSPKLSNVWGQLSEQMLMKMKAYKKHKNKITSEIYRF